MNYQRVCFVLMYQSYWIVHMFSNLLWLLHNLKKMNNLTNDLMLKKRNKNLVKQIFGLQCFLWCRQHH